MAVCCSHAPKEYLKPDHLLSTFRYFLDIILFCVALDSILRYNEFIPIRYSSNVAEMLS